MSDIDDFIDTQVDMDVEAPVAETESSPSKSGPSIDDAINAAFEKIENQPRDEQGRFAQRQDEQAKAEKPVEAKPEEPKVEQKTDPALDPLSVAPASWPKDKAALWQNLPPDAKQFLEQRERQISQGFARYQGVAEYADLAEKQGTTLRAFLDNANSWEASMRERPVETLLHAVNLFNLDPRQLAAALNGQPAPQNTAQYTQPAPPRPVDIQREVESVLQKRETEREVEKFFADPANKYTGTVSDHMAALITADRSLSLKDAYEQACWAHPQVRAELQREEANRQVSEKSAQIRTATQTAQRASKSLVGSVAQPVNAVRKGMTIDDSINAAISQHGW
jgi:hypothetical protein